MKFVSLILLLQVLLLSAAPALAIVSEAGCCATACAEEESELPGQEEHSDEAGEQCNPFSCAGCCLLTLPGHQLNAYTAPAAESPEQMWALIANPPLQPQRGIWHPPRLS